MAPVAALPGCRTAHEKTLPLSLTQRRGKIFSNFMMAMALLKNYHPFRGPKGLKLYDLFKKFDKTWALTKKSTTKYGRTSPERTYETP